MRKPKSQSSLLPAVVRSPRSAPAACACAESGAAAAEGGEATAASLQNPVPHSAAPSGESGGRGGNASGKTPEFVTAASFHPGFFPHQCPEYAFPRVILTCATNPIWVWGFFLLGGGEHHRGFSA